MSLKYDINKEVTKRLLLQPIKDENGNYKYGGLVPAQLIDMSFTTNTPEKGEYAGVETSALKFEWKNYPTSTDEPDRFATSVKMIPNTHKKAEQRDDSPLVPMETDTITAITTGMLDWILHVHSNLKASPNFKPLSQMPKATLALFDNLPVDPKVEPAERASKWNKLFEGLFNFIGGKDGNAMWLDKDGNPLKFWLKMLPDRSGLPFYSISNYVGKGFMEPIQFDSKSGKMLRARILEIPDLSVLEIKRSRRGGGGAPTDDVDTSAYNIEDIVQQAMNQ